MPGARRADPPSRQASLRPSALCLHPQYPPPVACSWDALGPATVCALTALCGLPAWDCVDGRCPPPSPRPLPLDCHGIGRAVGIGPGGLT